MDENKNTNEKKLPTKTDKPQRQNTYMCIGMCLGLSLGMLVFDDNMAIGMCIGLAIGVAVDESIYRVEFKKWHDAHPEDNTSDEKE